MERHLKFKTDYNWSEKGQAAVLIEGMFDPEPVITKMERMAAKCISAEQEAAQRKAELNSLKPTAATTAGATPVEELASRAVTPVDAVVHKFAAIESAGVGSTDGGAVFASPKPMKRNSVLNANPELANTLNKMFSAAASVNGTAAPASTSKAFRRNSTMAMATPAKEGAEATVVKEKKISQSKLLKVNYIIVYTKTHF